MNSTSIENEMNTILALTSKVMRMDISQDLESVGEFEGVTFRKNGTYWSKKFKCWSVGSMKDNGYFIVKINKKLHYVHRIIANLFHGLDLTSSEVVDHIDGNKTNNCVSNLRCVTQKENVHFYHQLQTLHREHLALVEAKWKTSLELSQIDHSDSDNQRQITKLYDKQILINRHLEEQNRIQTSFLNGMVIVRKPLPDWNK